MQAGLDECHLDWRLRDCSPLVVAGGVLRADAIRVACLFLEGTGAWYEMLDCDASMRDLRWTRRCGLLPCWLCGQLRHSAFPGAGGRIPADAISVHSACGLCGVYGDTLCLQVLPRMPLPFGCGLPCDAVVYCQCVALPSHLTLVPSPLGQAFSGFSRVCLVAISLFAVAGGPASGDAWQAPHLKSWLVGVLPK